MRLSSKSLAAMILVILFGGVFISSASGWWRTELTKQAATFSEGKYAGLPNPADIRGSYTFGDVENNFGVPAQILAQAFGISSEDPSAFEVKDLETVYADQELEIGTASVRLFVALYSGLPYEMVDEVDLPEGAAEMLKSQANLTAEQISYLDAHGIDPVPSAAASDASGAAPVPAAETHTETESIDHTLKGKTTFQEVLDWGVSQETIASIINAPIPHPLTTVKNYCSEHGLNFEEIRPAIQAEIDQIPVKFTSYPGERRLPRKGSRLSCCPAWGGRCHQGCLKPANLDNIYLDSLE